MGRKRKHDGTDEKIRRKIRKLNKYLRKHGRSISSSSSSECESDHNLENRENEQIILDELSDEVCPENQTQITVEDSNEEKLDDDILLLLGDPPKEESPVGKDIHNDMADRLKNVLLNGLSKEIKQKISEEYPTPGNCQYFKAPKLNPEVKAAISDLLYKKDTSLATRQERIGTVLTALTQAMDILIKCNNDNNNQILIKHISNACRLLCDSHFIDTRLRRNFLISTLNNNMKETLKETKRDKHLFGEDLPERLRASKAITKTGQDLKNTRPKSHVNKPETSTSKHPSNNLNWKHPHSNFQARKPAQNHQRRDAGYSAAPHHQRSQTATTTAPPRGGSTSTRARGNAHWNQRPQGRH
ncbi:uncharacterized protein LOC126375167 [Pectinophora gossypiella]|uniref:uncharacterized protein LOC126375167 n=1 Tax=Pectinophora gossypiella TaxID=13191 RepID=UPI00214EF5CD|nr:uncharacterized protein LOC126375167 [Pectinophora gossypiella]XP_049877992.1 uncharacterized protein LOC126375167 [Pectinophora gossypiella]